MSLGQDRRRFKRYDVDGIRGRLQHLRRLVVRNLSLTGLAVESTDPLRIGQSATLEMAGAYDALDVPVDVMWSRLVDVRHAAGGTENVYQAGLDFSRALDDRAPEILSFIEGHVIIDLKRELPGHFRQGRCSPTLGSPRDFRVKRVCFSGLLVESAASALPEPDSILEIAIDDEVLPLACSARVARIGPPNRNREHEVLLDFQNLSIDNGLALDYFIRRELE